MDQWSRQIIGFGIHQGPVDGIAVCRMFNDVISGTDPPCYVSSDNDPLFRFYRWKANLRILEVMEIKSIPYVPMSHPFIERVIGTIRREYLDHVPFWNSLDLERKLGAFKDYYNHYRSAFRASTREIRPTNQPGKRQYQRLWLATTLPQIIPHANSCVSTNSPPTRRRVTNRANSVGLESATIWNCSSPRCSPQFMRSEDTRPKSPLRFNRLEVILFL